MDAVTVSACGTRNWDWPCLHLEGADVVDLDLCWLNDDGTAYELPDTASDEAVSVQLVYRPAEGFAMGGNTGELDAEVASGHVQVSEFNPTGLRGVYEAVVRWTDDGTVRLTLPCILSVKADRFSSSRLRPSVTINDVHQFLYDRLATENRAEAAQEFPDRLLYDGYCAAIRQWRETYGNVRRVTSQRFPDRNMLLFGAAGWALTSYRTLLARNATTVAGQSSLETDRVRLYDSIGKEFRRIYTVWLSEQMRMDDATDSIRLA